MSNVVDLPCVTVLDHPPEKILERAKAAKLTEVVVVGFDEDGNEYFASSKADGANVSWLLQRANHKLMSLIDDD